MGFLIGLVMRLGAGKKLATGIVWIAVPLLIAFVLWRLIDNYGDRREQEGVDRTVAAYDAASARLREQVRRSASAADVAAADRLARHNDQVQQEVERINEAELAGDSPLDVLFGN